MNTIAGFYVVMDQVVSSHSRKDIVVKRVRSRNTHSRKKKKDLFANQRSDKKCKEIENTIF